jgi:steroid 5-alpha reductase family enzyme
MKRFFLFVLIVCIACFAAATWAAPALAGTAPAALAATGSADAGLISVLAAAAALALVCFAFGLATGDYSWVDRSWSLAPVAFAWMLAASGGFGPASCLGAAVVTLWGARLTANFARRGGYSGTEDYRWAILRERIQGRLAWQAFHALFICLFQIGVLVLITTPLARLGSLAGAPAPSFLAALMLALAFLAWETVADGQQWRFQTGKAAYRAALAAGGSGGRAATPDDPTGDFARGFRTTGLFAFSRHPNYFGELGFWWSIFLAGASAGGGLLAGFVHWSVAGGLVLTAIFIGSTRFTEALTAGKYPAYRDYQASVSAILPWFPGRRAAPAPARAEAAAAAAPAEGGDGRGS